MAKRTSAVRTKKEAVATTIVETEVSAVSAELETSEKLHSNEQSATSSPDEVQNTFQFRFWELGALKGKIQGVEVGHDGAPVDMFVFDEVNFEAFKTGQQHQYIGWRLWHHSRPPFVPNSV